VEPNVSVESTPPPLRRVDQIRVDDKGRLKLSVDFAEFLRSFGHDEVYICRLADRAIRVYPIPTWLENQKVLATQEAETSEATLTLAAQFGGTSKIDAEGRIMLPHSLRTAFGLAGKQVRVTNTERRIDIFTEEDWQAELADAAAIYMAARGRLKNVGFK
jgi:DNA-binding transcriptional regulator/RsmH inhibitor MraZ